MNNVKLARALYRTILRREPSYLETVQLLPELTMRRYFEVLSRMVSSEEARKVSQETAAPVAPKAADAVTLFVPPGHFYSPIVDARALRDAPSWQSKITHPAIAGLRIDGARMLEFWRECRPLLADFTFPPEKTEGFRYFYRNPAFGYGDALMLYLMLRTHQPRRVIEVGSGYSSALILDTIERFLPDRGVSITLIDPHPELGRQLTQPHDDGRLTILGRPVQDVDPALFDGLADNDILFIDSSHVAKSGSDVCHEFFNVLPFLNEGVLVHLHDIYYPFEYPQQWVYDDNRSWNETYLARAFLMYNEAFDIEFFNNYFTQFHHQDIRSVCPEFMNDGGGSLWLRKRAPALPRTGYLLQAGAHA